MLPVRSRTILRRRRLTSTFRRRSRLTGLVTVLSSSSSHFTGTLRLERPDREGKRGRPRDDARREGRDALGVDIREANAGQRTLEKLDD